MAWAGISVDVACVCRYAFWPCWELDHDDSKFEQRMDAVCREIGGRGRGRSALQALEESLSPPSSPALNEQDEEDDVIPEPICLIDSARIRTVVELSLCLQCRCKIL